MTGLKETNPTRAVVLHLVDLPWRVEGMPVTTQPLETTTAHTPWFGLEPSQTILLTLLALEIAVFAIIGTNFLSLANAFEVLRLSVEIGLLAVALTPVITSGGIDQTVARRWAIHRHGRRDNPLRRGAGG
jgi:hypothetical protein